MSARRLIIASLLVSLFGLGCAVSRKRPCTEGGDPVHERVVGGEPFRGIKSCYQKPDSNGAWVNDGKYYEWFPSEKISVTGEYKLGKKTGRWTEYDESGKKLSDRYFDNGKEVSPP